MRVSSLHTIAVFIFAKSIIASSKRMRRSFWEHSQGTIYLFEGRSNYATISVESAVVVEVSVAVVAVIVGADAVGVSCGYTPVLVRKSLVGTFAGAMFAVGAVGIE